MDTVNNFTSTDAEYDVYRGYVISVLRDIANRLENHELHKCEFEFQTALDKQTIKFTAEIIPPRVLGTFTIKNELLQDHEQEGQTGGV